MWLSEHYLSVPAVDGCRRAFTAHPAHVLSLRNLLLPDVAASLRNFLQNDALFPDEYGIYTDDGGDAVVAPEIWHRTAERGRFYRFGVFAGVRPERRLSRDLITYLKLRTALAEAPFRNFFTALTDLALGPLALTAHAMQPGDYLRAHTDDVRHRRIAFVLYLSGDWDESCGGRLHIVHNDGGSTIIDPVYNSLVVFDVRAHREHYITPVRDRTRLTIGGWYGFPV